MCIYTYVYCRSWGTEVCATRCMLVPQNLNNRTFEGKAPYSACLSGLLGSLRLHNLNMILNQHSNDEIKVRLLQLIGRRPWGDYILSHLFGHPSRWYFSLISSDVNPILYPSRTERIIWISVGHATKVWWSYLEHGRITYRSIAKFFLLEIRIWLNDHDACVMMIMAYRWCFLFTRS